MANELEAKQFEGKLRAGNILLSVHTENADELARAKGIFEDNEVSHISSTAESRPPQQRRQRAPNS